MKKYHKYYENTKNHGSAILMGLGLWVAIPLNFPALLTLLVVLRPMVIGTYYVLWGISFIIRKFRPSFPVVDHNFYIQLLEDCEKAEKNLRNLIKWLLQCLVYYAGYFWWLIEKASRRITVFFTNHQKNKPLILLPISDQTSIYTRLFSFLGEYFEAYRIQPGTFTVDTYGIIHILIRVEHPTKNGLDYAEFSHILSLRTINALIHAEEFSTIDASYWTEDTVYFPNVRENLVQRRLVVYIATSEAGRERIQQLSAQTKRPADDLTETIE